MDIFRAAMQRMRRHVQVLKTLEARKTAEVDQLAEMKGSAFYDKQIAKIDKTHESERVRITNETRDDMISYMKRMRDNIGLKVTKAPTADMVNTLSILKTLERVSVIDFRYYAEQMKDCPLAMMSLREIARKHNVHISVPDTEAYSLALDKMEGCFAAYLNAYTGTEDVGVNPKVRAMHEYYFKPEDYYTESPLKTSKNADQLFLKNLVDVSSPDMFNGVADVVRDVTVEYVFSSLPALSEFIDREVQGLDEEAASEKTDEILSMCPPSYSDVYYKYQQTGEESPLDLGS